MDGEPFLFQTPATLKLPGEMGEEAFSHHAGRGTSGTLSLIGFFRHLAIHHGRLGGQRFAARSGEKRQLEIARHDVGAATDIRVFGLSRNTGILCIRAVRGKPCRRHITRSRVYTSGLGKGWNLRRGAAGSCGRRTTKRAAS
ncbi:rab1 small GTP-binding protein [Trypanosoma cruzi]|nr:rab1 small GTP-binding protein [Trypanosoma cruzi]